MIAIAGAKGGCGKTVTTLGIVEAFARAETPSLAVDADRQLPNLHVVGKVDRKPTLRSPDDGGLLTEVAQQSPREEKAGIVTAPEASEQLDFESTLHTLANEEMQLVIDCPSGAGPDVVEPMEAADRVVIVTTDSKRSIEGAKTAIDVAQRLHVPVEGLIVNKCRGVPEEVDSAFEVPVLATVPEVEDPLRSRRSKQAYDTAAAQLGEHDIATKAPLEAQFDSDERLSTGIEALDRELGGGLPPGTVIALNADPNSQSEVILYELTTERGTLYLSTERSEELVRDAIDKSVADVGAPTIRELEDSTAIEEATQYIRDLPEGANLIIDTANTMERADRQEYLDFLNVLVEEIRRTGSIAYLHCLNSESNPSNRPSTEHFVDAVFDMQTIVDGSSVEQYLAIPKSRNERAPNEAIELDLTTGPTIGLGTEE